jgi:glyoxylase-like metal-dependent hydrolase (beta-lactamase superfamily II)
LKLAGLVVGPLEENCWLVGAASRCAVVDPGAESPRIFAEVDRLGLVPEKILLTHGHVDHIAHCAQVAERYGIGLWVHGADLPYLERPQWPELEAMLGARPCPAPERLLADGEAISVAGLELAVLHTPGHTPGGVCFLHAPSRTALVGDTIFAGSVGRTDLPGGDWRTLVRSIRERLFRLEGDWRLLPGHGPETSLEVERRGNPFVGAVAGPSPDAAGY